MKYLDIRPAENVGLIEEIAKNITIVQHERTNPDESKETYFVVTLKIKLEGRDSEVPLRREYCNYYKHPNGVIIEPEKLEHFAFGIYPFVRSTSFENMYKVLFYNKFNAKVQDETGFKLEFYHMENGVPTKYDNGEMSYNCTYSVFNSGFEAQKFNSIYYNVEKAKENGKAPSYIEFVELFCHSKNNPIKATALIAPKLKRIESMDKRADIAVDLGTSNTYVAYQIVGDAMDNPEVQDVCSTHHPQGGDAFNELVFMNIPPTRDQRTQKGNYFDFEEKFEHDLYLPPLDDGKHSDTQAWTVCMPTQLSEFMPARIVKSVDNGGFSFPIPTVINNYSNITDRQRENLPMIHSAIPFAYYDIGKRTGGRDNINDGNFKWCLKSDGNSDPMKVNSLGLYINELLFMVRTHLLCEKINLNAVRLVWTFPLAFTDDLVRLTKEKWEAAFRKYFGVVDTEDTMFNVNESLAPYHSLGANNEFNLLMDIGGGSTDVVGYYNRQPVFITSFEFAGNALYMTSNKNKNSDSDTAMESADRNIIKKQLQRSSDIKALFEGRSSYFSDTELIPLGGKLSNVMNYGFTKHHEQFESFFRNSTYKLGFLALFHNASLVYHVAQLSYTKKPDAMPRTVYMAGNGSNLFKLKSAEFGRNLVKRIFEAYYGTTTDLQVQLLDHPKTAAAEGALKIINDPDLLRSATLRTQVTGGKEEKGLIVYTFGDIDGDNHKILNTKDFSTLDRKYDTPGGADLAKMRENLQQNVIDFIELFDKVVCGDMYEKYPDGITKDWLIAKVKDIAFDNLRLQVGRYISDSYFFNYIALLMESISLKMIENVR